MKSGFCVLFVILVQAHPGWAAMNDKPLCPTATAQTWLTNQKGCTEAFAPGIKAKQIDQATVTKLCDCVADEYAKKTTCAEMKRYESDRKFQMELTQKIGKGCVAKYIPQKKSN